MDVRDFLSRELQEKEEECIALREEFNLFKIHAERDQKDVGASNEEAIEELNTENMFLKRELEYAEKKLANLGQGDDENAGDELAEKDREVVALRMDKQNDFGAYCSGACVSFWHILGCQCDSGMAEFCVVMLSM